MSDGWNPAEYAKFGDARRRPFFDLLSLVHRQGSPRLLDAGCGTGALTAEAHRLLNATHTVGVDRSPAMLATERPAGIELIQGTVPDDLPAGPFEVVVSNSALNWVPNHAQVFEALTSRLTPDGQLAVQMPSNPDSAFSRCCLATADRWARQLEGYVYHSPVENPDFYAALLDRLGFQDQRVGTWRYPQRHASVDGLVEFARGGLLSAYRERLAPDDFEHFVADYRAALLNELGAGPVFFAFRRVFVWGRRDAPQSEALH
jgi:trans-aconitate 2-methyltransferase